MVGTLNQTKNDWWCLAEAFLEALDSDSEADNG